jgi:hypothetical protein
VLSTDSITFKTSLEALQIRIKYRWQAIDQENEARKSQEKQERFEPVVLTNGDTKTT